jgi:hypothetical protein
MTIIAGNDLNDFAQVCRGSGVVGSHLQVAVDGVVAQRRRCGYLDWRFRSTRSSPTVPRLAAYRKLANVLLNDELSTRELGHDRGNYYGYRVHRIDVDGRPDRGKPQTVDESMDMVRRYFRAPCDLGGMGASGATGAEPRWCQRALTVGTRTPCAAVSSG